MECFLRFLWLWFCVYFMGLGNGWLERIVGYEHWTEEIAEVSVRSD